MAYGKHVARILSHPFRFVSVLRTVLVWLEIYFVTQEAADAERAEVIETEVDERIPPDDQGIYPYLFACVYILFVAWYLMDKLPVRDYRRARRAFLEMIHAARQIFLARPTRMRDRGRLNHALVRYTQRIDGPTNCYPSLHVALVMLSYQVIKDHPAADALLLKAMRTSCVDVCRSTMRTKQHSAIDVIGGIELSRRAYRTFGGTFEDLMDQILPELTADELARVRAIVSAEDDLLELCRELLDCFSGAARAAARR